MIRLVLGLVTAVTVTSGALAQSAVERGDYLVNTILTCGNCHTPRGPGGVFDMSKQLSGGPQTWDTPSYRVKGANVTPDPNTGIGKWSDAEIRRSMQDGVRPNGTPIAPIMPFNFYKIMTPADLDAVVAYLKSVPAVVNQVQASSYKAAMHGDIPPGAERPMNPADLSDPVKRGFYLVTIGHCMGCHTPEVNHRHDWNLLGTGGEEFKGPWGVAVARNITSHREKGIGAWTDAEIKTAITQGKRKDGSPLKPPMGYGLYAKMTDADLNAVVAYLRTVPPKE